MRTHPRFLALTVSLLMTPSLVPATAASAATPPVAPVLATGTLLDAAGQPAEGTLELLAWPETHTLEVGEQVNLIPVTTGTAGRDGAFNLLANPFPGLLSLASGQGGYVNFELRSFAGDRSTATHFSRFLAGGVRTLDAESGSEVWQARPGEPAAPVEVRLPAEPNRHKAGAVVPMVSSRCGPYELKEKQAADTLVGELRTEPDTKMAFFKYGRQADSDIGVGMRIGGGGGWSVSGDHHVSNSFKSGVTQWAEPFSDQDLAVRTSFDYGRFEQDCYDVHTEQIRGLGWRGGSLSPEVITDRGCSHAPDDFRDYYGFNGGFQRVDERAATYGGAAEAFGFSFRARSGHSENVQMVWEFGGEPEHLLCGDDDRPSRSGRIFAGETKTRPNCRPGKPC